MALRPSNGRGKISGEFERRLARLSPTQKIKALVMVRRDGRTAGRVRASRAQRAERMKTIRGAVEKAVPEIDAILERHNGERLAHDVSPLGCVPVKTTAAGLKALAASKIVTAILEDQAVSLI
jgi:hypothetical protein